MDYIDLINNLDNNKLKNINLINIEELYLLDLTIDTLKSDFIGEEFLDFNYEKIKFTDLDSRRYREIVETLPLMIEHRLVIIDDCNLKRDSIKKYEKLLNEMEKSFEDFNDTTYLFLVSYGDDVFKGKFFKALTKKGDVYNLSRLDAKKFKSFISKFFLGYGIKLDVKSVNLISERLRYLDRDATKTLYEVQNELSKLASNIKNKQPSFGEIEESIIDTFEERLFGMLDFMSEKNAKKAIEAYHTMKSQDDDMIFYMIIRQIRNMICVKDVTMKRVNFQTGQSYCGLKSFEYNKLVKFVNKFSMDDLLNIHKICFKKEIEKKMRRIKMDNIIERIILEFCLEGRNNG